MARPRQSVIESAPRRVVDPASVRVAATRALLLDAAERLFLDNEPGTVSVRTINSAAGLNPGAVHYHFGSKHGLILALLDDRLQRRLHVSEQLSQLATSGDIEIRSLVELAVEPILKLATGNDRERLWLHLLVDAIRRDPEATFADARFSTDRWTALVIRARPELSRKVARRRWEYAVALLLAVAETPVDGTSLIDFIVAGLSAS
jgi:AcrR family transcriptional regulator